MKGSYGRGLALSGILLLLAAGLGLASGPQPTGSSEVVGANANPAANARWFRSIVDTPGDVGQYASVTLDPLPSRPWVS